MSARVLPFGARRAVARRVTDQRRRELEEAIEAAIAALDALDGDADLEDADPCEPVGDEEPDLGACESMGGTFWLGQVGCVLDGEATASEWRA